MRFTALSVVLSCIDLTAGRKYAIEIGPRPSAIFFSSLLSDGLKLMKGVKFKPPMEPLRKDLGHVICAITLFDDHGLIKSTAPATGESRTLEVYPRQFAKFLGKALESRPHTKVEYEYFK
jgi:hypothetical protein